MKKIIVLFVIIISSYSVISQPYFQKITTGELVNFVNVSNQCAWGDYDNDGYQDLVISSYNDNCFSCTYQILLFHNNGNGTFTKITTGAIVNDGGWSRGCAWGDYDNDGWPDLFVSNYQGESDFLYHNNGNGTFTKIQSGPEVNDSDWGSTVTWADYD